MDAPVDGVTIDLNNSFPPLMVGSWSLYIYIIDIGCIEVNQ